MEKLREFIEQYVTLTDADWDEVRGRCQRRSVSKNQFYLRPGQVNGEFIVINQGTLRVFQTALDGQEYTAWLAVAGQSFCDLASFRDQRPTRLSVQALADTSLITLSYPNMQHLYQTLPVWQEFGRKLWEDVSLNLIDTILSFQAEPAEVRYKRLSNQRTLLQSAPLKYIAEFLGITPHTLSRLRRNTGRRRG